MRAVQWCVGASVLALTIGSGGSAWAAEERPSTIDEVVVTARRVEENRQTVPISIAAFSAEAMAEKSVINLGDLERLTPGLFYTSFGGNNTAPALRGIGTSAAGDVVRAVVPYFAEVPAIGASGLPPVFDLANIQVLKGPQGTLFGRNAFAGAILMTPTDPGNEFGGYLKASVGNLNYYAGEGAVDIPIVDDKVALRLSAQFQRRGAFIKNIAGPDADDIRENNFRGNLVLHPTENLKIQQIVDFRDSPQRGQGFVSLVDSLPPLGGLLMFFAPTLYACSSGSPTCNLAAAVAELSQFGPYKRRYTSTFSPISKLQAWGSTTKVSYAMGDVNFVNILGYRQNKNHARTQVDGLGLDVPLFVSASRDEAKQWTEEFHIDGQSFDSRLTWIAGVFYSHQQLNQGGAFTISPVLSPAPPTYQTSYRTIVNKAVFGQFTWDLSPVVEGLKLDLGARYNWDNKSDCFRTDFPAPSFFPFVTQGVGNSIAGESDCGASLQKFKFSDGTPTWTVALNYQANDDLLLYVTSRRGYREGTVNAPDMTGTVLAPFQSVGPEKVTDVEIGLKSNWSVGTVSGLFNIAAYHQWYSDKQAGINVSALATLCPPVAPPGNPFCVPANKVPTGELLINAGKQKISGVEAELIAHLTDDLTVSGNVAYTSLDSTKFTLPPFAAVLAFNNSVSQFSPKWAANASVRYQLPFHPVDPASTLVLNADFTYSGKIVAFGSRFTPEWTQVGARLDWQDIGRTGLTLSAFVTNLFDDANLIALQSGIGFDSGIYNAPRMYGLEAKMTF